MRQMSGFFLPASVVFNPLIDSFTPRLFFILTISLCRIKLTQYGNKNICEPAGERPRQIC
jgi:hypothetical protein